MLTLLLFACDTTQRPDVNDTSESNQVVKEGRVRFAVIGDAGTGNEHQYAVADAVEKVCLEKECDFALYLGDNFYEVGVNGIDDVQFQDKFELPYANLEFQFYAVLGNHDYGQLGVQYDTPNAQVEYTAISEKWTMPDRYYSQNVQHVSLFGIDTNALIWDGIWGGALDQGEWFEEHRDASNTLWNIAFGHHPFISNGQHGVAGEYDGLPRQNPMAGATFETFVEDHLCEKIDVYFSGHDHDLQWLEPQCGVEWIVSGAGGKKRSGYDWSVPTRFEAYDTYGFAWVEIYDSTLTLEFYNEQGALLYEGQIVK